jgi:hypothetical protein
LSLLEEMSLNDCCGLLELPMSMKCLIPSMWLGQCVRADKA